MNCRFKSLFSPYGDKKLGEFLNLFLGRLPKWEWITNYQKYYEQSSWHIFSRPFLGERVPQHVQNLVIVILPGKQGSNTFSNRICYGRQSPYPQQILEDLFKLMESYL